MYEIRKCTNEEINQIKENPLDSAIGSYPEFNMGDMSFCAYDNDTLVGCGGLVLLWDGVAEAWLMLDRKIKKQSCNNKAKLVLLIYKKLNELMKENNLRRIGALVRTDFERAVKLVETLGFKREGLLKKYAPDGRDMYVYGKVK